MPGKKDTNVEAKLAKAKEAKLAKLAKAKASKEAKLIKSKEAQEAKIAKVKATKEAKIILNPMSHIFVPKHEILSEKEVGVITKKYNALPKFFPQILFSDPVVREIGAKPGDMVKITRNSPTAGEFAYYRYVVMG